MKEKTKQVRTIHSSRTIMCAELSKVMDYAIEKGNYLEALQNNVTGKRSTSGAEKTLMYLRRLYGFDDKDGIFSALKYFWTQTNAKDKPLLAFLVAINNDQLLAESITVICNFSVGEKVTIERLEDNIERDHPEQYSSNTRKSMAQNIASSWKQAGFIEGKIKNIRTKPETSYPVFCFACLLAYLQGNRGEFIWNSVSVKALCLTETDIRTLAVECAKRDLIEYQYAGNLTAISFSSLLKKIEMDA